MSKEKSEVLLNLELNVESIANAARNCKDLDELALEIHTVSPKNLTLEKELFLLKAVPVNDRVKGKKKEFAPKTIGITSTVVETLSSIKGSDTIIINGTIELPKKGGKVLKLNECVFDDYEYAKAVAKTLAEVELEKAQDILNDMTETVNSLRKQIDDDRF